MIWCEDIAVTNGFYFLDDFIEGRTCNLSADSTTPDSDIFAQLSYRKASSEIRNPDGIIVFSAQDIEVPEQFSQVATDILAQKYFRKAGVPAALKKVEENGVPSWLWRSLPDEKALAKLEEDQRYSGETSAKQVFNRLAGTLDLLGMERRVFHHRGRCQNIL